MVITRITIIVHDLLIFYTFFNVVRERKGQQVTPHMYNMPSCQERYKNRTKFTFSDFEFDNNNNLRFLNIVFTMI